MVKDRGREIAPDFLVLTHTPMGYIMFAAEEKIGNVLTGRIHMEKNTDTTQDVCAHCRHKRTPRDAGEQKKLQSRINRIVGQLKGIQGMIDDNRYCGDVLIQIGAVESALRSLGYAILEEHMMTCVAESVQQGDTEILAEAVELMKKLN